MQLQFSGGNVFLTDLWGNQSDPFVQARSLFFLLGCVMCVQVAKQFLAERGVPSGTGKTNLTNYQEELSNSTNTTDMVPDQPDGFESNIENMYYVLGALCIVGTAIQIFCWLHLGCKLKYSLVGIENKTQSQSSQDQHAHKHNKSLLFVESSLLCVIAFLGFTNDETFRAFGISFTVNILDWTTTDASNLISVYLICLLICICVSIVLSKFVHVNTLIIVSILIGFIGTILMTSMIKVTDILWFGACLLGLGFGNLLPNALNAGKRLTGQSSVISSVIFAGAYAGRIVAPQVIGYVLDHEDPMWFLYLCVVYSGGMLVLSVLIQIVLCNRKYANVEQHQGDVVLDTLDPLEV